VAEPRIPSDDDVDRLVAIYVRARRRVEQLIAIADARNAAGTAAFRRQQLAALNKVLAQLQDASPAMVEKAVRESYRDGATLVDKVLSPAEPFPVTAQGTFSGVHEDAVKAMTGQLDARLVLARKTIGRQAADAFARIAKEQVEQGIAAGLTRREVSASIHEQLVREGTTAFIDRAGRRWPLDVYSEVAARTTTREAVSIGTANRCLELGHDLVTITQHANECPICQPFAGRTYSLTGETKGYPKAEVLPPFHPRCRHVATPAPAFDSLGRRRPGRIEPRPGRVWAGNAA
jgi:hypothetical protein